MSLLQLLAKPSKRNLLDVVTKLPNLGVGARVTRKAWAPHGDSFWEVTAVKPRNADGSAGKVWGVLTWRGVQEPQPRQINGRAKRVWRWMPSEEELARLQPMVKQLQREKDLQRLAAAKAAAAGAAAEAPGS